MIAEASSTSEALNFLPKKNMTHLPDLKSIGLKTTTPRLRILDLFARSPVRHLTADAIFKQLSQEGMDIGLATVYRVLTQFEQAGILKRHHFEADRAVYEYNEGEHHDHLVCLSCGRIEEFHDAEIERRQAAIAAERGFEIREHSLCIYAECTRTGCEHRNK